MKLETHRSLKMARQTNGVLVPRCIVRLIEVIVVCLFVIKNHISANTTDRPPTKELQYKPPGFAGVIFCTCDLTNGACDVNCCCDPDCTLKDRDVFSSCTNYYNPPAKDTCVQYGIIFIHNSPYFVNGSQPGILCIYVDNFPLSNTFLNVTVIKTSAEFGHYVKRYGKRHFRSHRQYLPVENIPHYKTGDPVLVVHENLAVGVLSLPRGLASESCVDSNPVSYMIPQKFSCTRPQTDIQLQCTSNRMWQASTYYKGFKVVKSPDMFTAYYGNFTHSLTRYAYLEIEAEERISHHLPPRKGSLLHKKIILPPLYDSFSLITVELSEGTVCFNANGEKRTCAGKPYRLPSPSLEVENHSFVCANVVSEVKYTIVYKNPDGIISVGVHFTLRNITEKDLPLRQSSEVTYLQPSHKLPTGPAIVRLSNDVESDTSGSEKPVKYSGNPGYIVGEPLRVGTLEIGHHRKMAAIKLREDDQLGLTMLTSGLSGDCQTSQSREPVKFGINMRSGCFIRFNFADLHEGCKKSQWATWIALRGHDPPTHIATFGNSDPHIVGDWVNILEVDARPRIDSAVYDNTRPGMCFNILSGLEIQIIWTKTGSYENAQAQIIGARFNYFYMNYMQCLGPSCQSSASAREQKFEVVSSVTFTDASRPAVGAEAVVKIPHLSLPIDFFYPFSSDKDH